VQDSEPARRKIRFRQRVQPYSVNGLAQLSVKVPPMIHVVAIITAKPGMRAHLLEVFKEVIPTVRAEQGCIEYNVAVDIDGADPAFGPETYLVIERWQSLPALKAHAVAPHMVGFGERARDMIAARAVHVLEPA